MATNTATTATDFKVVKLSIVTAMLTLSQAIERFDSKELEALSQAMRQINSVWSKYRTQFDAKLKESFEAGKVTLGDEDKGTGILPVRAFRKPDAAKPGRKAAAPKSEAEVLAEMMGLDS